MADSTPAGTLAFYKNRFEIENNLTRNVLKAISPHKLDYRPHERSPCTGQTAWAIVRGLYVRIDMASQGASDVCLNPYPDLAEILAHFEDTSRRHAAQLKSWPDDWFRSPKPGLFFSETKAKRKHLNCNSFSAATDIHFGWFRISFRRQRVRPCR